MQTCARTSTPSSSRTHRRARLRVLQLGSVREARDRRARLSFQTNKTLADTYGSYFAASAYSKFRPINPAKVEAAYQQNRRIEILGHSKDASVRRGDRGLHAKH